MSKELNNDIDILLRKLSGQQRNPLEPHDGQFPQEEHLDADELNAYAENALPLSLRARYTEHLADCTTCRKIVTQLSLASTAAMVPHTAQEPKPSTVKTFLAGLFSPTFFRYAVPAMAVVVVVAVVWVAVQRRGDLREVALNQSPAHSAPPQSQATTTSSDAPVSEGFIKGQTDAKNEAPATEKADVAKVASADHKQEVSEEKKLAAAKDEFRDREDAKRNEPPAAPAPAGAGASGAVVMTATPTPDNSARQVEAGRKESEVAQNKESDADKNKTAIQTRGYVADARARSAKSLEIQSRGAQTEAAPTARPLRAEAKAPKPGSDDGEVRTVGGHKFRRQGQVWVDSLYSSQSTTNVARGSEQYRALVADEPDIRSIADQLNGEFIIVWKGRAYRIR